MISFNDANQTVEVRKNFKKEFGKKYPTATDKLMTDLDQCLTFYLFPANHWRRMRTSNKIERLNRELKRRIKVIGRHPDESGCYHSSMLSQKSMRKINRAMW